MDGWMWVSPTVVRRDRAVMSHDPFSDGGWKTGMNNMMMIRHLDR